MGNSRHEHHSGESYPQKNMGIDDGHSGHSDDRSLTRVAISATIHCLSGCAIGEVLGMVVGTAIGLGAGTTIALSVVLAFLSGFSLTMIPLLRNGINVGQALKLAFLADAASITIMEIVDNVMMFVIPGAMTSGLTSPIFWASLGFALIVAGVAAFPVNRWLIARGGGHAVIHEYH